MTYMFRLQKMPVDIFSKETVKYPENGGTGYVAERIINHTMY